MLSTSCTMVICTEVIPYCIHLDEGRGLRKSAVLVIHFQGIFGADTVPNFQTDFAFSWQDHLGYAEASEIMLRNQFHNARGSTFFSRMLYTILPKASYTKRNSNVFTAVLEKLREECTGMLEDGFLFDDGYKYYGALIAVKGDAPALVKAGNFTRNFQCLGNPICWECMAGSPHVAFEDCSRNPVYESTLHAERALGKCQDPLRKSLEYRAYQSSSTSGIRSTSTNKALVALLQPAQLFCWRKWGIGMLSTTPLQRLWIVPTRTSVFL